MNILFWHSLEINGILWYLKRGFEFFNWFCDCWLQNSRFSQTHAMILWKLFFFNILHNFITLLLRAKDENIPKKSTQNLIFHSRKTIFQVFFVLLPAKTFFKGRNHRTDDVNECNDFIVLIGTENKSVVASRKYRRKITGFYVAVANFYPLRTFKISFGDKLRFT